MDKKTELSDTVKDERDMRFLQRSALSNMSPDSIRQSP